MVKTLEKCEFRKFVRDDICLFNVYMYENGRPIKGRVFVKIGKQPKIDGPFFRKQGKKMRQAIEQEITAKGEDLDVLCKLMGIYK